jgi:hypothetical protein
MKTQAFLVVMLFMLSTVVQTSAQMSERRVHGFTDWSAPVNLGPTINSFANDVAPALSRDGRSLYFTSTRLGGFGGEDIWVSHRRSLVENWETPVNLGPMINSGAMERTRYLSPNGHLLLFQGDRVGGLGGSDLWASNRQGMNDDFAWEQPINLGWVINTSANELGAAFVLGNQGEYATFYFASARLGGLGSADFYASEILRDGSFGEPNDIVELSSPFQDSCLTFRSDGLEVFFTSTRPDPLNAQSSNDLWASTRDSISDVWSPPENLGATINAGGFIDGHPTLSFDGRTLIFTSNRPGGFGGNDLYMITRDRRKGNH